MRKNRQKSSLWLPFASQSRVLVRWSH